MTHWSIALVQFPWNLSAELSCWSDRESPVKPASTLQHRHTSRRLREITSEKSKNAFKSWAWASNQRKGQEEAEQMRNRVMSQTHVAITSTTSCPLHGITMGCLLLIDGNDKNRKTFYCASLSQLEHKVCVCSTLIVHMRKLLQMTNQPFPSVCYYASLQ